MTEELHWSGLAERGSSIAIRLMAWAHSTLGRRFCSILLYPIVAYFFVRERAARQASRLYAERAWAHPDGRKHLKEPGFLFPFRHYHEFAVQLLDRMVLWGGGVGQFQIDHRGGEHLFALARQRRGGLLFGSHLGSFDMARQLAGEHGLALNVVMFTAHAERINRFFEELDPSSRVRVVQLEPNSVRAAFEIRSCIERGELVSILADRIPVGDRERPIWVDFLGRRAPFPRSPFLLACLLGCPALISFCVRTGDGSYRIVVEPLSEGRRLPRSDRDRGAEALAAEYVRRLEAACLAFPHQWFNFYDFWGPEGPR